MSEAQQGRTGAGTGSVGSTTRDPPMCASEGAMVFDDDVDRRTCETIREMWVNRLAGFHRRDRVRYLRDSDETTRYIKDGRSYSHKTFRRAMRLLFPLQHIGARVGVTLSAEVLDARVSRTGDAYTTRGVVVLMLAGRVVRQHRLTMSCCTRSGRWIWDRVAIERVARDAWRYRRERGSDGRWRFISADTGQGG